MRAGRKAVHGNLDLKDLRCYLERQVQPHVLKWDDAGYFPQEVFNELHERGLLTAALPTHYGGENKDMMYLLEFVSILAETSPGLVSGFIGNILGQTALSKFAGESLAQLVFEEYRAKRGHLSFCFTEKATGTDVFRIVTRAQKTRNGYIITGTKNFITNLNYADHLVVFARLEDERFPRGAITAFYVPANTAGVKIGKPLRKLGQNDSNTSYVEFDKVRVPLSYRVGEVGQGIDILETCVSRTKTLLAGACVGICAKSKKLATDYLSQTKRYGTFLLDRPEIQSRLAELEVQVEASKALGKVAGEAWDAKGKAVYESSVAKFFSANTAVHYVTTALELCGASGYMADHHLGKLYRDAKLIQIYEGASLVQLAIISRQMFGKKELLSSGVSKIAS